MPTKTIAPAPPAPAEPVPPPERPRLLTRFRRLLFRPRMLLFFAALVSATALIPLLAPSLPDLSGQEQYRVSAESVRITNPPAWIPADLVLQVLELSKLKVDELSLLDDDLARKLYEAFARHPWIAQVVRVTKVPPDRIDVELVYRRPVAMVEVSEGMYPIDADGTLLPPGDFTPADAAAYPLIQNVASMPQGPAGTNWGDVAVLGAARLAEALLQSAPGKPSHWERLKLTAIRVPILSGQTNVEDLSFELLAPGGSQIMWGRAPGSTHPGELSVEQKIGRLDKYLTDFGGFDRPHGPYEIDIRHWQEISRRPLSASVDRPARR